MNQQIYEEAAEWVIELGSPADAETQRRFDQWLATSPEHVRAYLECTAISRTAESGPRHTAQQIEELLELARRSSATNVISLPSTHSAREALAPQTQASPSRPWASQSWLTRTAVAAMLVLAI